MPSASLEALCAFSDYITMIAIISSIQLIFFVWSLEIGCYIFIFFLHLSTIVLFLSERFGEMNLTVLLFIKFHGQERIYQKWEVVGGGEI